MRLSECLQHRRRCVSREALAWGKSNLYSSVKVMYISTTWLHLLLIALHCSVTAGRFMHYREDACILTERSGLGGRKMAIVIAIYLFIFLINGPHYRASYCTCLDSVRLCYYKKLFFFKSIVSSCQQMRSWFLRVLNFEWTSIYDWGLYLKVRLHNLSTRRSIVERKMKVCCLQSDTNHACAQCC